MTSTIVAKPATRHDWLDRSRGLAIILMEIFHACFDLTTFHFASFDFTNDFWRAFRTLIIVLFFGISGWTATLGHDRPIPWRRFSKRFLQVAMAAILISLVTGFLFPQRWIYFGILHFFAVSMWVALPFRGRPYWALTVGIALFVMDATLSNFNFSWLFQALQPVLHLPNSTLDIARFTPWFGVVLIGIFLGHVVPEDRVAAIFSAGFSAKKTPRFDLLLWTGRHPLSVYLIHQPILYGLTAIADALLH